MRRLGMQALHRRVTFRPLSEHPPKRTGQSSLGLTRGGQRDPRAQPALTTAGMPGPSSPASSQARAPAWFAATVTRPPRGV